MRIRTIKPEYFRHAELYDCELSSGLPIRVAFAGLWCVADREGRFKWEPRSLKVQILPYDDCDFALVLRCLESGGFIKRYAVDGKEFGFIPSFTEHQHINQREAASILPEPTQEACASICMHVQEYACTGMHVGKGREGKGKEGNGKEGNGKEGVGENVGGNRLPTTVKEPLSDDQWIESLQASEAYKTLNVREQVAKCAEWCAVNGKQCSRRRVVNWLNRADRPMAGRAISGTGKGIPESQPMSPHTLQKQLEIVEREIATVRGRGTEDAFGRTYSDKDRELLNKLIAQRKEIKTKLGLL